MQTNISILEAQPFLKGMSQRQLELLAADCYPAEVKPGERILNEDGTANRFYLIQEGEVELETAVQAGETVHIETLKTGDLLGWSWLFAPYCWHFDARAVTSTKALCFYGTHVRELCEANHDLGYDLMKRVAETVIKRLQATRHEMADHSLHQRQM
jgi:CRP/FNR family cyclic AMP-dependent transcriptional regulator